MIEKLKTYIDKVKNRELFEPIKDFVFSPFIKVIV
jgi:hypothetical protein